MQACRPLLGTYVEIRVDHPDAALAMAAVDAGFAAIARVQRLMSLFDPASDISRINRLAHQLPVAIAPWTREVLALALELHAASAGLFDCAVAPRLAQWGLLPAALAQSEHSRLDQLYFVDEHQVASHAPIYLDLGGIAKGFAVDRAAEAILAVGASGGTINAGGDLRVFGDAEENIYLRHPQAPEQLHFAGQLREGACATSATYYSRRQHQGREVSALVNPLTGQALNSRRSYTVIAPQCVVADALTKVLALSGNANLPCFARYDAHPIILDHHPSPEEATT